MGGVFPPAQSVKLKTIYGVKLPIWALSIIACVVGSQLLGGWQTAPPPPMKPCYAKFKRMNTNLTNPNTGKCKWGIALPKWDILLCYNTVNFLWKKSPKTSASEQICRFVITWLRTHTLRWRIRSNTPEYRAPFQ